MKQGYQQHYQISNHCHLQLPVRDSYASNSGKRNEIQPRRGDAAWPCYKLAINRLFFLVPRTHKSLSTISLILPTDKFLPFQPSIPTTRSHGSLPPAMNGARNESPATRHATAPTLQTMMTSCHPCGSPCIPSMLFPKAAVSAALMSQSMHELRWMQNGQLQ